MKGIILCRFDQTIGPVVLLKYPENLEDQIMQKFSSLMDLHDSGFFIHTFDKYQGINRIFEVPSDIARGNREILQISMIFGIDIKVDTSFTRDFLEKFTFAIKNIECLYKAFYNDSQYLENKTKMEELKNIFRTFYESAKSALIALKNVELKYQTLFKTARDAIVIFELVTGNIIDINLEVESILEGDRESILRSNIIKFFHVKEYENFYNNILKLISDGQIELLEMEIKNTQKKKMIVEISASNILIGDQKFIQLIIRDISKRKLLESRLKERVKELNSLYRITKLMEIDKISLEVILHEAIEIILSALEDPKGSCVRILYNKKNWFSENFKETQWKISTHIQIKKTVLDIEVFYLIEKRIIGEKLEFIYEIAERLKGLLQNKL
ncbi:MAG: PAS domain S-box protein [Candidatus Lokiarchaeota archaeon]|nr:PAS domain S-box protein [Candidatus Lokiarchaeota archaeon]